MTLIYGILFLNILSGDGAAAYSGQNYEWNSTKLNETSLEIKAICRLEGNRVQGFISLKASLYSLILLTCWSLRPQGGLKSLGH